MPDDFKRFAIKILIICAVGFTIGYVTSGDIEEAQRQQEEYCFNVKNKIWPDYQGAYKMECKNISK